MILKQKQKRLAWNNDSISFLATKNSLIHIINPSNVLLFCKYSQHHLGEYEVTNLSLSNKCKWANLQLAHFNTYFPFKCKSTYFSAAFVISCVQAPWGFLVMTGSEPPPRSVATVLSKSAGSKLPFDPAVSFAISPIIRFWCFSV